MSRVGPYFYLSLFSLVLTPTMAKAECAVQFSVAPRMITVNPEDSHPKAHVLMLHGLNNKASVMLELARDLCASNFRVTIAELRGHNPEAPEESFKTVDARQWLEDFEVAASAVLSQAELSGTPAHIVAYSLGALVSEAAMSRKSYDFKKIVYLAPAIGVKWYAHLLRALPLFDSAVFKSRSIPEARAHSGTSMAAYRALFDLRKLVYDSKFLGSSLIPHLVFLSQGDELVSAKRTERYIRKYSLENWATRSIVKSKEARKHSPSHYFVDKNSAGSGNYELMLNAMRDFLK